MAIRSISTGTTKLVLDLGCGTGSSIGNLGEQHTVIGIDLDYRSLLEAKAKFPTVGFTEGRAEKLPFADATFQHVNCSVALPYCEIRRSLAEVFRVLRPGGTFYASVHRPLFTLGELRRCRNPRSLMGRLVVVANGVYFHSTGRQFHWRDRQECFQTKSRMQKELSRVGFVEVELIKEWPLAFHCLKPLQN